MEDNKMSGAKNGLQTMLLYYLYSLIGNVEDPKQYIATEIGKMIDLSEEQIQYVEMNIANDNKLLENLSSSINLLDNIEKTGKLDMESIKIVKGILEIMKNQCKEILDDMEDAKNGHGRFTKGSDEHTTATPKIET